MSRWPALTLAERFEQHVDRSGGPDACHPWTGTVNRRTGYGQIKVDGVAVPAHRVAYELENGPIPDGDEVDHECHNGTGCPPGPSCPHRRCCNGRHLASTTSADNNDRSHNAQQHKRQCPADHEYTPENTRWHKPKRPGHNPSRSCKTCERTREQARSPRRRRTSRV